MKKSLKKKQDHYARNFIALSLAAFFLFFVFVFVVCPIIFHKNKPNRQNYDASPYLNKNYNNKDPLITKVPTLNDVITGPIINTDDPLLGDDNAPITITLYTNFTCFFCGDTLATIKKLQTDFSGLIKIVHKDYPNANKSFTSYQAAIAGRCAQKQNKFWEMSDELYKNFNALSEKKYLSIATQIGLNVFEFTDCLDGKITDPVVNIIDKNIAEANALGIVGVPTVYVNDHELPAEITYTELKTAVEKELQP